MPHECRIKGSRIMSFCIMLGSLSILLYQKSQGWIRKVSSASQESVFTVSGFV